MSLILMTCFNKGILLASDPFVFDNDGEVPSKSMIFEKVLISEKHQCALVAVGSNWVFLEAYEWLEEQKYDTLLISALSEKWKVLNEEWKDSRTRELTEERKTLRPISDSVLIFARQGDLREIHIIDPSGQHHVSKPFVLSGSGADIARHYLESKKKRFDIKDSVGECLVLVKEIYQAASHDLYVTGFPAIVILSSDEIKDLTKQCDKYWQQCRNDYWQRIVDAISIK